MQVNNSLNNFGGGLLSKKLLGRIDLPIFKLGLSIVRNFVAQVQGPMDYRGGSRYVAPTRLNGDTALIPFVFNDEQAYALAFSDGYMRVFTDGGIITESAISISDITQANPAVVTTTTHGYTTGDQTYVSGVVGMKEVNGKFFLVTTLSATTFSLSDIDSVSVNSTAYDAYSSGGTSEKVYEITTPYTVDDIHDIKYAQKADLMYSVHPDKEIHKLRRTSETGWVLETFTRTNDPFTTAISGATNAASCAVTATDHGLNTGDDIEIYSVLGMTELNENTYDVLTTGVNTFVLRDPTTLAYIDSTGYGAYTSGGYLFKEGDMPGAVGFYGGRVLYGGTLSDPEMFIGSRGPTSLGATQFDDFTVGATADDAIIFPIASQNNTADKIHWFAGNNKFLAIGTYGGVYKAYGATESAPITGTEITVVPVDFYGCQDTQPLRLGTSLYYVQRGAIIINRFMYDIMTDGYTSDDLNVLSDEITETGVKRIALQQGRVNVLWAIRNDGLLIGLSVKEQENIAAWHTHYLGGTDVKVLSICGEPQPNNNDNLWMVVERTIDGKTRRYVEYFTTDDTLPELEDYYTGDEDTDDEIYGNLQYESAKQLVRVDSSLTLDTVQALTLSVTSLSGTNVAFTVPSDLFEAGDVDRRVFAKYLTGEESGIAEITSYVSTTEVRCNILEAFSAHTYASGAWYFAVSELSGLDHLEGETVSIVTDGAVHPQKTVANGAVSLDYPSTVTHVGLPYIGWLRSMPLEIGGINHTAQTKVMTVDKVGILFRHTLGTKFGTNPYGRLEQIVFRTTDDYTDRPPRLFSGAEQLILKDGYDFQKYVNIIQDVPLPCTIQAIVPYVSTTNE